MAEIKEVVTLDVQLLNANRESVRTYKFDNPRSDVTRAQISEAFQPALVNSWLIAADGSPAMYIGDTIINTSKKVSLDGQDFYVTPTELNLSITTPGQPAVGTVTVTGAQIQGYNFKNKQGTFSVLTAVVADNGLTATLTVSTPQGNSASCDLILIILGKEVVIPVTITG